MVRLWDVTTLQQIQQLRGHGSEVISVNFSGDGKTIASGSKDKTARLWSVGSSREVTTVTNVITRHIFSPDGRFVAAGVRQGGVAVWEASTLQLRAVLADAYGPVAFSPDSSALTTAGTNYFLRTFDLATQSILQTIPGSVLAGADSLAVSPDGRILAAGFGNGSLGFFKAKTGEVIATETQAFSGDVFQMVFSFDGKLLAAAGREMEAGRPPTAKIWEMATQKKVAILTNHTDIVLAAVFSPEGKTLVTSGADDAIRFWDTTTWKEISPSLSQKEPVVSLAISSDGKTLASVSSEMKLWNFTTRRELASLRLDSPTQYIAFSPDGETLAAYGWDHTLRLWRAPGLEKKRQ
jgi:WD40 repeat protein